MKNLASLVVAVLVTLSMAPGQVSVGGTLTPLDPGSQLSGGGNPPLITVSTDANPGLRVPVYNARIPVGVPFRIHVDAFPAGVWEVHYSLQSLPAGCAQPCATPNGKQVFNPPALQSNTFTMTVPGPDAVIVWYPSPTDTPATVNQLGATQQRLPFVAIDSAAPNGAVRTGPNSFKMNCNPWTLSATLTANEWPFTFGIRDMLCLFSQAAGGTGISCAVAGSECFSPTTLIVP